MWVGCGVLAVGLVAVVAWVVTRDGAPGEPVEVGGWSGQSVLCGYREGPDPLNDMEQGDVVALGDDPAALLTTARCVSGDPASGNGRPPVVSPDASYFVAFTGADRIDVTLVDVDAAATPARLVAEHTVNGDGCAVTADYRGQLMLLIEGPADSPVPRVEVRRFELGC